MGGVLLIGWKIQTIGMQHTPTERIIRLVHLPHIIVQPLHLRKIAVTEHVETLHAQVETDHAIIIKTVMGLLLERQRCLVRMEWVAPYMVGRHVDTNAAVATQARRIMFVVERVGLLTTAQQAKQD